MAAALAAGLPSEVSADYRADYDRALRLGRLGYEYGYPLLRTLEVRRESLSMTGANELRHDRELAGPESRAVPTQNVDTLYTNSHLDLSDEPVVLTVPEVGHSRYYSFQLLDPFTNVVDYVGSRTTGQAGGHYAITPEDWEGGLPGAAADRRSPRLHAPRDYTLPSGLRYFDTLGALLAVAPPPAADEPLLDRLALVGVGPGRRPSSNGSLSRGTTAGLRDAVGWTRGCGNPSDDRNGWRTQPSHVGRYETDYCLRANVARGGLGANTPEESIYWRALKDASGAPLSGSADYVLHLDGPPPADAFWSLTAYGQGGFLEPNPLGRYALGDRSGLRENPDGSVDLYLSHDGDVPEERNWLPVPAGQFSVVLRLYAPRSEALDGTWSPPAVTVR